MLFYLFICIRTCIPTNTPCLNLSETARSRPDMSMPMLSCSDLTRSVLSRQIVSLCKSVRVPYSPVHITVKHNPNTHHSYNGISQDKYFERLCE